MIVKFPVLEITPVDTIDSITEVIATPLFTIILLNAEAALPLIVLLAVPLKLTDPVPALNVPLFTQSPFTSRLIPALKFRVPPALINIPKHPAVFTLTVTGPAIITASPATGTSPPTQVVDALHNPPVPSDVIVAKGLSGGNTFSLTEVDVFSIEPASLPVAPSAI